MSHDHNHEDHNHAEVEVDANMLISALRAQQEQLSMMHLMDQATRLAMLKLLPNVGDSVTIDLPAGCEMVDENGADITTMSFFRAEDGLLDIRQGE